MSDTESLNTSVLSDTSSDDETSSDINVFEFNIDGNKKLCGLNKPQDRVKSKNPVNKDKILNKKQIEYMLKSIGRTAHSARNTKIQEACSILYDADEEQDSNNNIISKKPCSYIQNSRQNGLQCLDNKEQLSDDHKFLVNKMSREDTVCEDLTHKQLIMLAKLLNVQYKGKKNQICNNLVKHFNKNQTEVKMNECYKNIKSKCNNDDNCNWLFESKDLLIQRLQLLDLLSNNKNHKSGSCNSNTDKEYTKCSVEELLFKLRNTFNMKHLTSRCINKNPTEKTKTVVNNYKLTIFRETLKYFYNHNNNLDDILTSSEINSLNEIIDFFNTTNKHTTLDEFIIYEKKNSIFIKILQNELYLSNIVENICKLELENSSESRQTFLDKIFKVLKSFNLANLEKIKNNNICTFDYSSDDSDDSDDSSSESLPETLSDTDEENYEDTTPTNIDATENNSSNLQTNTKQQYLFLQNNLVGKLFI